MGEKLKKKALLLLMSLIIVTNFVITNYSYAIQSIPEYNPDESVSTEDLTNTIESILDETGNEEAAAEEEGGALFTPISQFILAIADGVISTLQSTFIGDEDLSNVITSNAIKEETPGNKGGKGITTYRIKYSPAKIFSGSVPAFDINFFSPLGDDEGKTQYYKTKIQYINVSENITYEECKQNYGTTGPLQSIRDKMSLTELLAHGIALISVINAVEALANTDWDYALYGVGADVGVGAEVTISIPKAADLGAVSVAIFLATAAGAEGIALADRLKDKNLYYMQWQYNNETYFFICDSEAWLDSNEREKLSGSLYKLGETEVTEEVYEKTSTAYTLRPIIATWYIAIRNIALVGLLSVLLYVGIRIIISTTSQDKAKYKKMLIDWFTAILILFVLHYGMVFIINITQKITEIFTVSNISIDGTDKFITNIRNMATGNNNDSYFTYFGYVIMYVTLVILTVIFTIQYIKRLIFIAFLTMVAPLIALTYPIDKIKDGQAQAFAIWIREYVFNCLLQPVHLLLYTIFIESASQLVNMNPVYAVIALAFFIPAEKFFRKMFGFERANSVGTIGAAAGGAMLMNMMNKLQGKARQNSSSKQNNKNKVRTVNKDIQNDNEKEEQNETMQNDIYTVSSTTNNKNNLLRNDSTTDNGVNIKKTLGTKQKKISGVASLKSTGRWVAKAGRFATNNAIKMAGAFGGATIGLSAGIASGDLENTAKYAGAGAIAGANITSGVNNKISKHLKKTYEDYKVNELKKKVANPENVEKEKNEIHIKERNNITEKLKEFSNNGLTDVNDITMAVTNGITGEEYKSYKESGINKVTDIIKLKENEITQSEHQEYKNVGIESIEEMGTLKKEDILPEDVKHFKDIGQEDMQKVISAKQKHPEYSKEGMANMFKLAKTAPKTFPEFKNIMINKVFNGKTISEKDAKEIFDSLSDFW